MVDLEGVKQKSEVKIMLYYEVIVLVVGVPIMGACIFVGILGFDWTFGDKVLVWNVGKVMETVLFILFIIIFLFLLSGGKYMHKKLSSSLCYIWEQDSHICEVSK